MLKKLLVLSSALLMFSCTNTTGGADESKEDQMARLLEEANKVKTVKVEKTVINDKGEEVVVEEEQAVADQDKRSHKGMTRGEIMEYESFRRNECPTRRSETVTRKEDTIEIISRKARKFKEIK